MGDEREGRPRADGRGVGKSGYEPAAASAGQVAGTRTRRCRDLLVEDGCGPGPPTESRAGDLFAGTEAEAAPAIEALAKLLERSRPAVKSVLRRHGIRVQDSEDLMQSAILVVVRRWREIQDPLPFLLGTLRHLCEKLGRSRQGEQAALARWQRLGALERSEEPQAQVERQLDARRLLAELPADWRRIIEMRYGEELSSQEVAAALGCTAVRVRQCARRAVQRLRCVAAARRPDG